MTKKFDRDSAGAADSPLAGILAEAMSRRHRQLHTSQGSIHDVRMRARRITRRRTAIGVGTLVAVGTVGAVAVATRNGGSGGQRLVIGANDGASSAGAAPGSDGGYWECTGLLNGNDELLARNGGWSAYPMPSVYATTLPTVVAGDESWSSTTVPYAIEPSTTAVFEGTPSTVVEVAPTTTWFDATSTTYDPSAIPSTTVDFAAFPSTIVAFPSTVSSFLPVPIPAPDHGVYYMSDCTHVDGLVPADTVTAPTTTLAPLVDPGADVTTTSIVGGTPPSG